MLEMNLLDHDRGRCDCGGEKMERTVSNGVFRVKGVVKGSLVFILVLAVLSCTPVSCADQDSPQNKLVSQSTEVKSIEPTHNPTKVFVRRRIFRKLVKDTINSSEEPQTTTTTTTTTTPAPPTTRPRTLYSIVKRIDPQQKSSTVTGTSLKTSMSNSQSLASRQKFNFQSLKTRLGLAAQSIQESTTPQPPTSTTNASLVMIPLPPNQRKPYTPVIMQVSKSTTAKPETKVQTFKLNKMFVPIGIYGKVVENTTGSAEEIVTESSVTSSSNAPSIRHRGTDSGEKVSARKVKGIADTIDITYGRPNIARVSLTTEKPDIASISLTTEVNELFSGMFGESNDVRRGDTYGGNRNNPYSNSGLTLMTPPKLGTPSSDKDSPSTLTDSMGSYATYASYNTHHKKFTPSSIVDSITDSMSRIPSLVPSLFHKGLTSLASMTSSLKENPFEDENFDTNVKQKPQKPLISAPSTYTPKIPASVPGGYISGMGGSGGGSSSTRDQATAGSEMKSHSGGSTSGTAGGIDISEYETLEYFRKRPHLLAQLKKQAREMAWRRSQGVRMSKGFKPVNAPDYLAREYYKSTSTTASTPQGYLNSIRSGKKMRGSWLLRNSNEYVSNKNDKVVRMWRSMLDSLTTDEDPDFDSILTKTRRIDEDVEEDPSSYSISSRSSTQPSSILSSQWSSIKRKYSKDQINEARERILTLLDSGYGDEALHEIADDDELQHQLDYHDHHDHHDTSSHMPPPPPPRIKAITLTKGLSGAAVGAFKDLVKFFKLGVSVGAGHSHEPVKYEEVVDEQEGEEIGGSEWKPVRRPLISFSAGISLKNPSKRPTHPPPSPPPHHHHHYSDYEEEDTPLTHFSSSSRPYIPTAYKGLNTYIDEIAHTQTHSIKPTPYSYVEEEVISSGSPQSLDYADEELQGYGSATSSSYASPSPVKSSKYQDTTPSYSYDRYSTLKPSSRPSSLVSEMQQTSGSSWSPVGSDPSSEYELVPSSVYLNGGHDPRDIAAVVKPAGVSDDLVRSVLPSGLRNLRILDYPNGYSSSLNSISQVLGKGGKGVDVSGFKHAMKKLRENYVAKESAYLPPGDSGVDFVGGLNDYVQVQQAQAQQIQQAQQVQQVQEGSSLAGVYGRGISSGGRVVSREPTYSPVQFGGLSGLGATYYNPVVYQQGGLIGALSGIENGNVFSTADRINNVGRGVGLGGAYGQVQIQNVRGQVQQSGGGSGEKDSLGFSTNYNLPSSLDPDIAALLKSELDKDDIPDDVRQEFLEAKEQEKKEQAQKQQKQQQLQQQQLQQQQLQLQQQQQQYQRRIDDTVDLAQQTLINELISSAKQQATHQRQQQQARQYQASIPSQTYSPPPPSQVQHYQQSQVQYVQQEQYQVPQPQQPTHPTPRFHTQQQQHQAQSRVFEMQNQAPPRQPPVVATRFFAPIPITPTLMTTALKNPRYSSPVPRYVIELANKLQKDKSVQGIVRVSAKRGRGLPPIEYLYPVKG